MKKNEPIELSLDDAMEILDALAKAVRAQAMTMSDIIKHLEANHSLSLIQFEQIRKANEGI